MGRWPCPAIASRAQSTAAATAFSASPSGEPAGSDAVPGAMHRGDVAAARRELVTAQRLRPDMTYALASLPGNAARICPECRR